MEPPEIEKLKNLQPYEQVIEQIRHIHKVIEQDLVISKVNPTRRYDLIYEEFCSNPKSEIKKIQSFLDRNGLKIEFQRPPPDFFHRRGQVCIEQSIYEAMKDYANRS